MARIDFRLSQVEKDQLQADAVREGRSVSDVIRFRLFGAAEGDERFEDLERRVSRLEEMAGL